MDEWDKKAYLYGEKGALYLIDKHLNIIQKSTGQSAIDSFFLAFCRAEEESYKRNPYTESITREFHVYDYSGYTEEWFRQNFNLSFEEYVEKTENIKEALKTISLTKEEQNLENYGNFLADLDDL